MSLALRRLPRLSTSPWWLYVIAILPATLLILAVAVQPWIPPADLLQDPVVAAKNSVNGCCRPYFGAISNLGVIIWCGAASICFFAALTMTFEKADRHLCRALLYAAALTALLMTDDMFLLHERVIPWLTGVNEKVVFLFYGIATLGYLVFFARLLLSLDAYILLLALGFFAASVGLDFAIDLGPRLDYVLEDGMKLMGVSAWASFHIRMAYLLLVGARCSKVQLPELGAAPSRAEFAPGRTVTETP